jgi:hypothetical protein
VSASSEPARSLAVDADLSVSVDGRPLSVRTAGDRAFVDAPTLRAALAAARGVPRARLAEFDAVLRAADLTVEWRVRESPVLVLGAGGRAGRLSTAAGVAPAEFRAGGLLVAVGRTATAVSRRVGQWVDEVRSVW